MENPLDQVNNLVNIGKGIIYVFAFMFILNIVSMMGGAFSYVNPVNWWKLSREQLEIKVETLTVENDELRIKLNLLSGQREKKWSETLSWGGEDDYKLRIAKVDSLLNGDVIHCDGVYVLCIN